MPATISGAVQTIMGARAMLEKLDEVGSLPAQQAKARKPEVDVAVQAVMDAYDKAKAAAD